MGSCRTAFHAEKMRTIRVKSLAFGAGANKHQGYKGGIAMCKQEVENLQNCWRTSGTDSRNCLGLVASLSTCIGASYLKRTEENAAEACGGKAIDAFNAVIDRFMRMK